MTTTTGGGKVRIYTKTGDAGTSALYNGQRLPKDDATFAALGDVDELNSALGVAREALRAAAAARRGGGSAGAGAAAAAADDGGSSGATNAGADAPPQLQLQLQLQRLDDALQQQLEATQSRLLDVGSAVATPSASSPQAKLERARFDGDGAATAQLERWLDQLDDALPPLRNFILPSGGAAAASLHLARSVCRRAERSVVPLVRAGSVGADVGAYLNRLSDYLFTAARFAAQRDGHPEAIYKKAK